MRRVAAAAMMSMLVISALAAGQGIAPGSGKPAPPPPAIATVGSRRVAKDDFERRVALGEADYRERNGADLATDVKTMFRRQMLENMIRLHLLVLEAQRQHLTASVAEADEALKRDPFFNPGGHFDAGKFALMKSQDSRTYQATVEELRLQLAGQALQQRLVRERSPSDSVLRDAATRAIGHAAVDYFGIDLREIDGQYAEPGASEVLAEYRSHAGEYRNPVRASLTVLFVDQPALPESLRGLAGEAGAWDARMRTRADSAIGVLRAGADWDSLSAAVGSVRTGVDVLEDNFPGYWRGSRELNARVFRASAGEVLKQAVPSNPGYLVVRVDHAAPAGIAPLAEVSPVIRRRLRAELKQHQEERELQALFAEKADSLRGPAVRLRYATIDTAAVDPGVPGEADLDRYYRGHLADYSTFDTRTGTIRSIPIDEIRSDLRNRWLHDHRMELAQTIAEGLDRAWGVGRRDAALERAATSVREIGPLPVHAPVDSGIAASVIADSLAVRGAVLQGALVRYSRGFVTYRVFEVLRDFRPTFEQARGPLRTLAALRRDAADRIGARALFDQNPRAWVKDRMMNFSRILVPFIPPLQVHLTRGEVLRYYREHFDAYSAPEQVHARHILISPTGPGEAADRVARQRADSLLRALRAGDDFATTARQVTDDPATRENGGELGTFGRGAMLPEFERAAFALKAGEFSGPVRTQEGYHLIQCIEHLPLYAQPLAWTYPNVGYDAASEKADSLARRRADSLLTHAHSPAEARAIASRLGLSVTPNSHPIGDRHVAIDLRPYMTRLESLKPGQFDPQPHRAIGMGYWVTWMDSISDAVTPRWDRVEDQVLEVYRRGAPTRAAQVSMAELDSMMTAGWSFDSLATLWGGVTHVTDVVPSAGIKGFSGSRTALDSLVYGARGGPPLATGAVSGWVRAATHALRIRLVDRFEPRAGSIAQRMEAERRVAIERALRPYFDELAHRYTVQIADPDLKRVALPPLPPPSSGLP